MKEKNVEEWIDYDVEMHLTDAFLELRSIFRRKQYEDDSNDYMKWFTWSSIVRAQNAIGKARGAIDDWVDPKERKV